MGEFYLKLNSEKCKIGGDSGAGFLFDRLNLFKSSRNVKSEATMFCDKCGKELQEVRHYKSNGFDAITGKRFKVYELEYRCPDWRRFSGHDRWVSGRGNYAGNDRFREAIED